MAVRVSVFAAIAALAAGFAHAQSFPAKAVRIVVPFPAGGGLDLICSPAEVSLNPALYAKMTYDPFKELAPISLAAIYPNVIVVGVGI